MVKNQKAPKRHAKLPSRQLVKEINSNTLVSIFNATKPYYNNIFEQTCHVYSSCVQNAMLHASEAWPLTRPDLQCLRCNDRAMIRQICNVKPENVATVRSNKALAQLEIDDLDIFLREKRFHWFGHFERSSGAIKTVCNPTDGDDTPAFACKRGQQPY